MDANSRRRVAGEQAANWFVLLRSDALTGTDREEFVAWLRESDLHVAEMLRVMRLHNALRLFSDWQLISPGGVSAPSNVVPLPIGADSPRFQQQGDDASAAHRGQKRTGTTLRRRLQIGALAASVGALLVLSVLFFTNASGKLIQTERGERREVTLVDGSLLEIAPESRIRVSFEPYARRVSLEQGRAVFRVAKNPTRPFSVRVNDTTVQAVGTAFGVERNEDGVRVTVAEGKVAVSGAGSADAGATDKSSEQVAALTRPPSRRSASQSQLLLTAGEQVLVKASGIADPVRQVDSNRELAWARGRLVFENETILRAIATFNRYNRIQMRVTDAQLAERVVSGIFDASDPESFIAFIQTDARVRVVRREGAEIIISKVD